jgi:transcriptional regulator with XRE-family HTH domain
MSTPASAVGEQLRAWRQRRRLSQLALANDAEISTRHLSFLETGRARPSREMVLHLAERLEVPLRERNLMLVAAGFAPVFPERRLDDPALQAARRTVELVLAGHEPHPAVALDRRWNLLMANRAVAPLLTGAAPSLLEPPVNVLRLSLHPQGLASRILNLSEWRAHLLARLRRQIELTADPALVDLLDELRGYPAPSGRRSASASPHDPTTAVAVPFRLASEHGELVFLSTTTMFGTPVEITLAELVVESFFPADAATAETMRRLASAA